jgi:deoxyribonuclease-4
LLFKQRQKETGISPVVGHDSYLINLASTEDGLWNKSISAFSDELERCAKLGVPYLVMHPGSYGEADCEYGASRVADALNRMFGAGIGDDVMVLLETTSGQASSLGSDFHELARVIELAEEKARLGICFDTCHAFASGYELRSRKGYQRTFGELDAILGLDRLKVFHLNDCKGELGAHLDRHEHIGQGHLGLEPFRMLLNDRRFRHLPMLLETPKGKEGQFDEQNLAVLRSLMEAPA